MTDLNIEPKPIEQIKSVRQGTIRAQYLEELLEGKLPVKETVLNKFWDGVCNELGYGVKSSVQDFPFGDSFVKKVVVQLVLPEGMEGIKYTVSVPKEPRPPRAPRVPKEPRIPKIRLEKKNTTLVKKVRIAQQDDLEIGVDGKEITTTPALSQQDEINADAELSKVEEDPTSIEQFC